jgi:SSS family solute:Na+ symporter
VSFFDWSIVVALNGSIIVFGLLLARGMHSSAEWFLAGRRLPYWIVGISMYATAIDASDLVADSGGTYTLGFGYFPANMVGMVLGWVVAGFFVFLPMYRAGMYTNAEYLEARFGPATRVLCALVQVQYRTFVLAIMGVSLYWILNVVCGLSGSQALLGVVVVAIFASIYTAFGGLRSVAITDVLQFGVMTIAALVVWFFVLDHLGGWSGVEERLTEAEASYLLHCGSDHVEIEDVSVSMPEEIDRKLLLGGEYDAAEGVIRTTTPSWLVALGLIIMGLAYPIVNHTQSMRMFASKSEWDLKMSVSVASLVTIVMSFFNLTMGVLGRAWMPDQALLPEGNADNIYPWMVSQIDTIGLRGIVVAGIFAAAFSTYDSIGSSLSALLTRDVYARFVVRNRTDHHYLRVGQWLTPVVIGISFGYMPILLEGGMLIIFVELTSAFVIPLLTVFLMGRFTRVHRSCGTLGLLVGAAYGGLRLLAPTLAESWGVTVLPGFLINSYSAYVFSMLITACSMIIVSFFRGWETSGATLVALHQEQEGWLRSSQEAVQRLASAEGASSQKSSVLPAILAALVLGLGCYLCFILWW